MVEIQQDVLRATGGIKESSETRDEGGQTVTYHRVESQRDECGKEAATIYKQNLEDTRDLQVEELKEVEMGCVQYPAKATVMVTDKHGQQPRKVRVKVNSGADVFSHFGENGAERGSHFEET